MKEKAQAMLKFLLSVSEHREDLLPFFPTKVAEEVRNTPLNGGRDAASLFSNTAWIDPIHFSWFFEIIEDFPAQVRPYFLNSLSQIQVEGLRKILSIPETKKNVPLLRPFVSQILQKALIEPDLLPIPLLPGSPLNILLDLDRKQLIHLADFLGLHDLAADLRQVVDKDLLQKIHQALTPNQLHFLHYCSKQAQKWVSPKLGLARWDGSRSQLSRFLHARGLNRLAKATVQEDPSFKWHLMHHLDTGRARVIQKEFYRKQNPALRSYFINQVLHIAKRYHV